MRQTFCLVLQILLSFCFTLATAGAATPASVPILTYHNFDPAVPGSMTISTAKFAEQLQWLKGNGYTVIPLKQLVNYLQGKTSALPTKSVVITADDGRETVYKYMLPLVRKYNIPVTLFIYPTAISNARYALTWQQLKELQSTGLFDIQDHTYWHPNFKEEKRNLASVDYQKLVHVQLVTSKKILDEKLGTHISLLAWPYGIYDKYLESAAKNAGYTMAFSIDDRSACKSENVMSQPRYMISERQSMKTFAAIVDGSIDLKQRIAMNKMHHE
jgi:peptidoglycan/xylan/chitin deacetylase (PgdA/CDA1 family)